MITAGFSLPLSGRRWMCDNGGLKPVSGCSKAPPASAGATSHRHSRHTGNSWPCGCLFDSRGLYQPSAAVAVAAWLVAGTAAVQLGGTDTVPTRVARPTPAETAEPPRPDEPIAEPAWLRPAAPIADGAAVEPINKAGFRPEPACPATAKNPISPNAVVTAGLMLAGLSQLPDRTPLESPEAKNEPMDEPVCPSSMFKNPAIPVVAVFDPGAKGLTPLADIGDASPCNVLGTEEITCDSADCVPALDDVPAACATASPWLAAPAALVVSGGDLNGATAEAAADEPA